MEYTRYTHVFDSRQWCYYNIDCCSFSAEFPDASDLCAVVRYTAGMVWFNEQRDEWLQMRQTVMKIAPVSMATVVNSNRPPPVDNNEASFIQQQQQQQRGEEEVTDGTATQRPPPG